LKNIIRILDVSKQENSMKIWVGITDNKWFENLSEVSEEIDEVNFWQPSGKNQFRVLKPGELFLFKLHSPYNYITGGGFFAHSTILPVSMAWDAFGKSNGANSLKEMCSLIEQYRGKSQLNDDYKIVCIILSNPFFFRKDEWIPLPQNWKFGIRRGKSYDTSEKHGEKLWEEIQLRLKDKVKIIAGNFSDQKNRYGSPITVTPRLGQGAFRVIITDVYERRGAVTGERALPTLEAAHIKPFSESGPNDIGNGILFRSDIHRLFDKGYATISQDYHFEVSRKIKEEFHNGETYYKMHGSKIHLPGKKELIPKTEFITWHKENVYLG
jgi:putative restriction endonuclease